MFTKRHSTHRGRECILVEGLGNYSLSDTMECGQCFRYEKTVDSQGYTEYSTVVGHKVLTVGQDVPGRLYFYGITDTDFEEAARAYFNLDTDLNSIKEDILSRTDSEWLMRAADGASGIAILKQDPWESLVSFIISQNNNIPRIRKIIRQICSQYGVNITLQNGGLICPFKLIDGTPCEEKCRGCGACYTFPTAEDIVKYPEGLLPSKPGFRYSYILDAAERVYDGRLNLDMIGAARCYSYTKERLMEVRGVGEKVASCVALFGFGNLEAFPIDVWMKRAIDLYFDGNLDPSTLGRYAGVAQQYIFHYIRNIESKDT